MNVNTAIMLAILCGLVAFSGFTQGFQGIARGLKGTLDTFAGVWPLIVLAFVIAGFLQVVIPKGLIATALGPSSGLKGYFVAWGAGAVMPGAPFAILPVAASLLKTGASVGPIMTMVLSAGIGVAVTRIPFEVGIVGWRFAVLRVLVAFLFPVVGGLLTSVFARWLGYYV